MKTLSFFTGLALSLFNVNQAFAESVEAQPGLFTKLNDIFGMLNGHIASILFFDITFFLEGVTIPFAVAWLVVGSVYFTFRMKFVNFRFFKHAIDITRGKYDKLEDKGEVSHFEALTTALSATVGLGNIAGVAVAISLGGPGATFWMVLAGLLGMTSKFVECTLGQMYREVRPDGHVLGGPMEYLSEGLKEMNLKKLGSVLAVTFAVLCIGGSLGGGGAFQVNQSLNAIKDVVPILGDYPWAYGLILVVLVGVVILGGIRRIADVASKIVPLMCGIYVLAALYILAVNIELVPGAVALIFKSAFSSDAAFGGFIGVLIMGFQRAAFSNEAGLGSASIAHSAAKTEHPVQEGIVALLEPFIDTVVVCTMTALVLVITGAYNDPMYADLIATKQGAALTSQAFGSEIIWFPYVLSLAVFLFAYSTIISWSYYGERCVSYLFSEKYSNHYKIVLLVAIFLGSITTSTNILDFSDLMILGMGIPNILGLYLLFGKVKTAFSDYQSKLKSGAIKPTK